jgi:hypothetical protein
MMNMKKYLLVIALLFSMSYSKASAPADTLCNNPVFFCNDMDFSFDYSESCGDTLNLWFYFKVSADSMSSFTIKCLDSMYSYSIFGPYASVEDTACNVLTDNPPIDFRNNTDNHTYNVTASVGTLAPGYYYLRIQPQNCVSQIQFIARNDGYECPELACEGCVGSFAPIAGKKYLVSAWVKEHNASQTKTSYTYPRIYIIYPDSSITIGPFTPTGQIIDGWQRIEGEFTIPEGTAQIQLKLDCQTGDCYFDDLRIQPFDGSMKAYVYDPVTLRLVAELDERNYATIYEYDEEGKLIRVKKETERGIMTIQESKTSITKQ